MHTFVCLLLLCINVLVKVTLPSNAQVGKTTTEDFLKTEYETDNVKV